MRRILTIAGVLILSLWLKPNICEPSEKATKPADFYRGKTIVWNVPSRPGGGWDLTSRLLGRKLGERLGVTVIITNRAGGGGIDGLNQIYRAKPDGLNLGLTDWCVIVPMEIMDEPGLKLKNSKVSFLIGMQPEPRVLVVGAKAPFNSLADLQAAKGIKFGGFGPTDHQTLAGVTIIHFAKLDAKIITGFKGFGSVMVPKLMRGELDACVASVGASLRHIEANRIKPLALVGTKRYHALPNVPAVTELMQMKEQDLKVIRLWQEKLWASKLVFMPPGVPKDKVAFLRETFRKIVKEPETLRDLVKIYRYKVNTFLTGAELEQTAKDILKEKEQIKGIFVDWLEKYRR